MLLFLHTTLKNIENEWSVPIGSVGISPRAITEQCSSDAVAVQNRPETLGPSICVLYWDLSLFL
jgi:hypothetical protein